MATLWGSKDGYRGLEYTSSMTWFFPALLLLVCSSLTPYINTHKAKLLSPPPWRCTCWLLCLKWPSSSVTSKLHGNLGQLSFPQGNFVSLPAPILPRPSADTIYHCLVCVSLYLFLSLSSSYGCHLFSVMLTGYGNCKDQVLLISPF